MTPQQQQVDRRAIKSDRSQRYGCAGVFLILWGFPWFAGGCLFLSVAFLLPLYRSIFALNWHATPCTITASEVRRGQVEIGYVYDFGGGQYQSDRYNFNETRDGTKSLERLKAVRDRYRPGNPATCYVKPSDPSQAVINRRFNPSILPSFIALILQTMGLIAVGIGWQWLRGGTVSSRSRAELHRDATGATITLAPIGLIRGAGGWLAICINALWLFVIIPLSAVVLHSALADRLAELGPWSLLILIPLAMLIVNLWYVLRTGYERVELGVRNGVLTVRQMFLVGVHEKQWVAKDVASVRVVPIAHADKNFDESNRTDGPGHARLEIVAKDGTSEFLLATREQSELEGIAAQLREALSIGRRRFEDSDWLPQPDAEMKPNGRQDGAVELRADESPLRRAIGSSVIALIWFGFLAYAGREAVLSFLHGRPDWFVACSLLPFVLFGLILVRRAGYSFLEIFSPQPTITLSRAPISLGDTVELNWQFSRNVGSLRSLELYLWGEERAKVRCRGRKKTRIVTESFAELPIVELSTGKPFGTAQLRIPDDMMHSFAAAHGGIDWSVQVFADVSFWPDVAVGFPIVVLPRRLPTDAVNERT